MESYLKTVLIILLVLMPFLAVFIPAENEAPAEEGDDIGTYAGAGYLETLLEQQKALEEAKSELEKAELECKTKKASVSEGCNTMEAIGKVLAGFILGGIGGVSNAMLGCFSIGEAERGWIDLALTDIKIYSDEGYATVRNNGELFTGTFTVSVTNKWNNGEKAEYPVSLSLGAGGEFNALFFHSSASGVSADQRLDYSPGDTIVAEIIVPEDANTANNRIEKVFGTAAGGLPDVAIEEFSFLVGRLKSSEWLINPGFGFYEYYSYGTFSVKNAGDFTGRGSVRISNEKTGEDKVLTAFSASELPLEIAFANSKYAIGETKAFSYSAGDRLVIEVIAEDVEDVNPSNNRIEVVAPYVNKNSGYVSQGAADLEVYGLKAKVLDAENLQVGFVVENKGDADITEDFGLKIFINERTAVIVI